MIVRGQDFFFSCSLALTGTWAAIDRWQSGIVVDTDCAKAVEMFGFMISHGLGYLDALQRHCIKMFLFLLQSKMMTLTDLQRIYLYYNNTDLPLASPLLSKEYQSHTRTRHCTISSR